MKSIQTAVTTHSPEPTKMTGALFYLCEITICSFAYFVLPPVLISIIPKPRLIRIHFSAVGFGRHTFLTNAPEMDPDIQDVTVVQYESVRPPGLGFLIQNFADFTKGQEKRM